MIAPPALIANEWLPFALSAIAIVGIVAVAVVAVALLRDRKPKPQEPEPDEQPDTLRFPRGGGA